MALPRGLGGLYRRSWRRAKSFRPGWTRRRGWHRMRGRAAALPARRSASSPCWMLRHLGWSARNPRRTAAPLDRGCSRREHGTAGCCAAPGWPRATASWSAGPRRWSSGWRCCPRWRSAAARTLPRRHRWRKGSCVRRSRHCLYGSIFPRGLSSRSLSDLTDQSEVGWSGCSKNEDIGCAEAEFVEFCPCFWRLHES